MQNITDYESVCKWFCEQWVQEKPTRQAIATYCQSAEGYKHIHTVYSQNNSFRWSTVKNAVPVSGDIQAMRGTKLQALAYIRKEGIFEEQGEIILAEYSLGGEIQDNRGARNDLQRVGAYINDGLTPQEIMNLSIEYRKHDRIIKEAYFAKRNAETPFLRDIVVEWHVGESGTGKTYLANTLAMNEGEDNIYLVSDYENGGLDLYNGEPILFLDEFRGQIKYSTFLSMLQGYKQQFHARYTNIVGLWNRVYITSVYPPEALYRKMVADDRDIDTLKQLFRRLSKVVYHYRAKDGSFCVYEEDMSQYTSYENMKLRVHGKEELANDGYIELSNAEQQRIDDLFKA